MSKKTFLGGAIILSAAGLLVKFLGAIFRIPLANIIGADGIGYYQTAYPIYSVLLIMSTSGIPTAVSKLVSEKRAIGDHYGAQAVFRAAVVLLFFVGIVTASVFFLSSKYLVMHVFRAPGAYYAMIAIAPALLFVPVMSAFRGYFQGHQDMRPTAVSQIVEQLFRVIPGLVLAYYLTSKGLEYAAAGASFGATSGAFMGTVVIVLMYVFRRKDRRINLQNSAHEERPGQIMKKLFAIAIPITIGAEIMPIMNVVDLTIVMNRLQDIGFTYKSADVLYGQLSGLAAPLINFPQILIFSMALSLVPVISAANETRDYIFLKYNVQVAIRSAIIIGLPCAAGLMVLAEPIMLLLYPMQKASAVGSASCLFILASGILFLSLVQVCTSILQGIGKPEIPVRNLLISCVFKIVCTYLLTGIPSFNVRGAAIGTVVAYMIASILNLNSVLKFTKCKFDILLFIIKPALATIVMGTIVFISFSALYKNLGNLATVISVFLGMASYSLMLIGVKAITQDELMRLRKKFRLV